MADCEIDLNRLDELIASRGLIGLKALLNQARNAISSGGRVIVQRTYINVPPDVEKVITHLDDLETWRKIITPIPLKVFLCPLCNKSLTIMDEEESKAYRLKCYDPPGCGSIYILAMGIPLRLMKLDVDGGPEIPYPANEQ